MTVLNLFCFVGCNRYIPSKNNREIWGLEKEIKALILKIVKEKRREEASATSENKDLLQMVLEGATIEMTTQNAIDTFIVDNCKNIYLAGYETTAVAATWCLMLLAANPIWQQHVRDEVMQICKGHEAPDADMIRQMKQVYMYELILSFFGFNKICILQQRLQAHV